MKNMKIAVTYADGEVFQHFGHTEHFKVYDVEDGAVKTTSVINTDGSGHCALADLLKEKNVDTLICGGIGEGAKQSLAQAGIALFGGVTGDADKAVKAFLAGKLSFDPDAACGGHSDGNGHSCHEHGHEHGNEGHCGGNCQGHAH